MWILYVFVLIGLNMNTPDFENYRKMFESANTYTEIEPGYRFLCVIFHNAGFTFQEFRMLVALIYVVLIYKTVSFYTKNVNYAFAFLTIFPLMINVSGLRFTLASAIACYSLKYLTGGIKRGTLKYIIGIAIAAMFHYSILYNLLFIFAQNKNYNNMQMAFKTKNYISIAKIAVVVSCIAIVLYTNILVRILPIFTKNSRFYQWLDLSSETGVPHLNFTGVTANIVAQSGIVALCCIALQIYKKRLCALNDDMRMSREIQIIDRLLFIRNISVLTLLITPAYILTSEYQRIYMGILPVMYAGLASIRSNKRGVSLFSIYSFVWVVILLCFYIYQTPSFDVFATLTHNLIFAK